MSSLQKFHRRTNDKAPVMVPALGSGSDTKGYYLGPAGDGISYMYVAPKSTTLVDCVWGSQGTARGTVSTTDGLTNTNTLYAFGSTAHPAAYYCKTLTQGGYNTWYLPAKDETYTMMLNQGANPFAISNGFTQYRYIWSSTEDTATSVWFRDFQTAAWSVSKVYGASDARAVRRSLV